MYTSRMPMYNHPIKRLQIYIEKEQDEALAVLAARSGTSKAELIRRFVAEALGGSKGTDPLDALVGSVDADPADVDDVVYGSGREIRRHIVLGRTPTRPRRPTRSSTRPALRLCGDGA